MKHVLVTGAGGYLGGSLVEKLLTEGYTVTALTSSPEKLKKRFPNVNALGRDEISSELIRKECIDAVVHCAFARRYRPEQEIAESIVYSNRVFFAAAAAKVSAIVNISSQGVYGMAKEIRTEQTPPAPTMAYTMAKYASELLLENVCGTIGTQTCYTNIRLDSIAENQQITAAFVKQAMEKQQINIVGGKQIFSFLSGRDFAPAISALLKTDPKKWERCYNVGWKNRRYLIIQLAEAAVEAAKKFTKKQVIVHLEPRDVELYTGMDSSKFMELTGWAPQYNMVDIFTAMFEDYVRQNKTF